MYFDRRAGLGKSIAMKQACLAHVQRETARLEQAGRLEDTYYPKMPFYYEAKDLAHHLIELHGDNWREDITGFLVELGTWNQELVVDDLARSNPELNMDYFDEFHDIFSSPGIFFIDAYDECSEEEKEILPHFIRFANATGHLIVISTRSNDVENLYRRVRSVDFLEQEDEDNDIVLSLAYNKEDLQQTMPRCLATAWGIDEINKEKVENVVDSYRKVLTHPVFVGLFCRLLQERNLHCLKRPR